MALQFGIWSPVCGGWLRVVNHEANLSAQDLVKLAVQADELGYDFYYIPEHYLNAVHGPNYNVADAWITAALASLNTKNIKIVAAVQPGFKLPAVVAKLSANIQNQLSNGRFALSGIAGWWKLEVESYGDIWLPHSDRYGRNIKVAMRAFAIVREHTAQAEARLEAIYRSADEQQIKYFQEQIDPNVVAHNKLDISQTIEANLSLSAQLVGDRYTIIQIIL
jgi:alkanesulfonate monooxygenase SsuD/methylene tetrahydromethanopterin reductase-like flavin-dependent oxidoreductase (luciferase family)